MKHLNNNASTLRRFNLCSSSFFLRRLILKLTQLKSTQAHFIGVLVLGIEHTGWTHSTLRPRVDENILMKINRHRRILILRSRKKPECPEKSYQGRYGIIKLNSHTFLNNHLLAARVKLKCLSFFFFLFCLDKKLFSCKEFTCYKISLSLHWHFQGHSLAFQKLFQANCIL